MAGAQGDALSNYHSHGSQAAVAEGLREQLQSQAEGFLQEGQVKLGDATADNMDKGKENGQWWIKEKLNIASTHGVVKLMGVTNRKGQVVLVVSRRWLRFLLPKASSSYFPFTLPPFLWAPYPNCESGENSLHESLPMFPCRPWGTSNNPGTNHKVFPQGFILAGDEQKQSSEVRWCPRAGVCLEMLAVPRQGLPGAGSYQSPTINLRAAACHHGHTAAVAVSSSDNTHIY